MAMSIPERSLTEAVRVNRVLQNQIRKAEQGLKRKSFWLSEDEFKIIESFKKDNNLKTNDEALQQILKNLNSL